MTTFERVIRHAMRGFVGTVTLGCALAILLSADRLHAQEAGAHEPVFGAVYLDLAYLHSSTQPGNGVWRTKGTSAFLDELHLNNVTGSIGKLATPTSRWGFAAGLQAGKDIDKLVSSSAVSSADTWKHLAATNASYLFDAGAGLELTGGLLPGHIGYEGFQAMGNPTYTRVYGTDNVPYYNFGLEAHYAEGNKLSGFVSVVNGWDYLASGNDAPSLGGQITWLPQGNGKLVQNLYYGPEQDNTNIEYWRFVTNTLTEWQWERILFAASIGYGTEKQAGEMGQPRKDWGWGGLWLRYAIREGWNATIRPEFFSDGDGLISGNRQDIWAITVGTDYRPATKKLGDLAFRLEYRFDQSNGPDGGFFEGDDNVLVPEQHLFIAAINWEFRTDRTR